MKIISKYKDYYDYLQGIYGIDDKVILDRREGVCFPNNRFWYPGVKQYDKDIIYICGNAYDVASDTKGNRFVGKMLLSLKHKLDRKGEKIYLKESNGFSIPFHIAPYKTDFNEKYNCPILKSSIYNDIERFPRLSDFNIQKILSAEDIFHMLYTWIESHKIIDPKDNRTNNEKIISAGFDLKSSFRNIK